MVDDILKFIEQYITLSEDEIRIVKELQLIREFGRNTVLLSEGETATECYFVLKGCVRSYYIVDGEEKTTAFYTEQEAITPVSYASKQPSEYYLACTEDCVLSLGTQNDLLIARIPRLKTLILQLNGELLVRQQVAFDRFKYSSPEERYRDLLQTRPDLVSRVPQKHLASYLGITPESLSRIRRRLIANERSKD